MKQEYLIIHCTDTPRNRDVTPKDIYQWHIKERGWSRVGYSDMIMLDGSLENLIKNNHDDIVDNWEISNGARGYNKKSKHVVYVGGGNGENTLNKDQERTLMVYCYYHILVNPNIKIIGHNQVSNKKCPSFDVYEYLRSLAFPEENLIKGKL